MYCIVLQNLLWSCFPFWRPVSQDIFKGGEAPIILYYIIQDAQTYKTFYNVDSSL